jgi:LTXXQ motif family protein
MFRFTRTASFATMLGAIAFASPLFAASGDLSPAAATKSPAAREIVAQATSPEAAASPAAAEPAGNPRVEARIKALHKSLHITDAEKPQWDALTQVMRDNAQAMADLQKQRAADAASMNAVDAVKSYGEVIQAHNDGMKKFIPAFEAFYSSLSDKQKKTADSMFRGRAEAAAAKEAK